jgi:CrcB protein
LKTILFIFVGGGIGSVCRYFLGGWISRLYPYPFPLGTLTVNILACFIAGLTAGWLGPAVKDSATRLFLITGFCGGFSTFSAFTLESAGLLNDNLNGQMAGYIAISLGLCIGATFLGLWLATK